MRRFVQLGLVPVLLTVPPMGAVAQDARRVTILYDAFGAQSALTKDWGFATLIEYGGRRVLVDTGNDEGIFGRNAAQLKVDLSRLDAVVISHRHGDHTTGLGHLLRVNPVVTIYAPQEGAFFKGRVPLGFLERSPALPPNLRYYDDQAGLGAVIALP